MKNFRIFGRMNKESMQISFDGQSHQIDANILITTLIHYTSVIQQANGELSGGTRNVQVNINAFKEGSFVVDICLSEGIKSIFSAETVAYLAGLTTVVGGVFGLYKTFKGKPVSDTNTLNLPINIKGNHNNITVQNIINVYNNREVRTAISKSIEIAREDPNVEGITISGDSISPVTFEQKEFTDLVYDDFDSEGERPDEIDEYVDTTLVITGLKFERGGQWNFIYNGFKIKMVVKDDALMKAIDNGERFGKGDSIRVKMKITKKYNPDYNVYENKTYRIVEFYEHITNDLPRQNKMF